MPSAEGILCVIIMSTANADRLSRCCGSIRSLSKTLYAVEQVYLTKHKALIRADEAVKIHRFEAEVLR